MSSVSSGQQETGAAAGAVGPAGPSAGRLAWLDALRGFAALCVVFDHGSTLVLQSTRDFLYHALDLGQYGVFVFFLVSGYIVPASLERKGSTRAFWISRGFRLYPMYLLALVLSALLYVTGYGTIRGAEHDPATAVASWALMLPNLLTGPNVPNVVWTLSYEMVFYLLLAALFSWRVHRHSGVYATGFAVAACVLGGVLPMAWLQNWGRHGGPSPLTVDIAADALVFAGIVLALTGRQWTVRIGATVAALTGLVLMTFNQGYPWPWSGLTILALMFTGTMVYRAEQGQVSKLAAAWTAGLVLALAVLAGLLHGARFHLDHQWRDQWVSSIVLAGVTFALGLTVRKRKIPAAAAWLGLISYSVYLLHPLVFTAYQVYWSHHHHYDEHAQIVVAAALLAIILAASAITYYTVEKPMQRLGRRVARWTEKWAAHSHDAPFRTNKPNTGAGAGTSVAQARSTSSSSAVAGGSGGSP
jgi:peptidoglycan/LPS O-acetylase OafA/YrhL